MQVGNPLLTISLSCTVCVYIGGFTYQGSIQRACNGTLCNINYYLLCSIKRSTYILLNCSCCYRVMNALCVINWTKKSIV